MTALPSIDIAAEIRSGSTLGKELKIRRDAMAHNECLTVAQKWPRCAYCAMQGVITPHPMAMYPAVLDGKCPVCGTAAAPAEEPVISIGVITATPGTPTWFGLLLMKLGHWLANLGKGI